MGAKILRGSTILADTPTVALNPTAADQVIKAWNIAGNKFEYINVQATIVVTTAGGSTAQTLDVEVLNDVAVKYTFNIRAAAAVNIHTLNINVDIKKRNKGTITIQLGNTGAEAVTTVVARAGKLLGID